MLPPNGDYPGAEFLLSPEIPIWSKSQPMPLLERLGVSEVEDDFGNCLGIWQGLDREAQENGCEAEVNDLIADLLTSAEVYAARNGLVLYCGIDTDSWTPQMRLLDDWINLAATGFEHPWETVTLLCRLRSLGDEPQSFTVENTSEYLVDGRKQIIVDGFFSPQYPLPTEMWRAWSVTCTGLKYLDLTTNPYGHNYSVTSTWQQIETTPPTLGGSLRHQHGQWRESIAKHLKSGQALSELKLADLGIPATPTRTLGAEATFAWDEENAKVVPHQVNHTALAAIQVRPCCLENGSWSTEGCVPILTHGHNSDLALWRLENQLQQSSNLLYVYVASSAEGARDYEVIKSGFEQSYSTAGELATLIREVIQRGLQERELVMVWAEADPESVWIPKQYREHFFDDCDPNFQIGAEPTVCFNWFIGDGEIKQACLVSPQN